MVVLKMKCQMCGKRFEVEALDREDPQERRVQGSRINCPNCGSYEIEKIQALRRVPRRRYAG